MGLIILLSLCLAIRGGSETVWPKVLSCDGVSLVEGGGVSVWILLAGGGTSVQSLLCGVMQLVSSKGGQAAGRALPSCFGSSTMGKFTGGQS